MKESFCVFDVETPNYNNDRISAIGLCMVKDGEITESRYWLCNPETYFNGFNIELTGITPQMVENEPAFPELWNELFPYFDGNVLVAHNAPFDMGVLSKCCRDYGISDLRYIPFACTVQMSRCAYPFLINHKLNTVSEHLGIDLTHHMADSDAHACAEILIDCMKRGVDADRFIRIFDIKSGRKL